jgi:flagellar biogenesis protein FliO
MFLLFLLTETFPETSAMTNPFTTSEGSAVDFSWLFIKVVLAMVVVCLAAFAVIKYLLPRASFVKRARESKIEIIERFGLEPKKNLYILKVATKVILVGTTETSMSRLLELSEGDLKESHETS